MSDISLMAISVDSEKTGIPPRILIEKDGVWQDTPSILGGPLVSLEKSRDDLNKILNVTTDGSVSFGTALEAMRYAGKSLYQQIVPQPVSELLKASRADGDEPPVLRIHVQVPEYDWIPWEILHDDVDFLGLSFMVARVPIVTTPPDTSRRAKHPVRSVRNLLAENVFTGADEFDDWQRTFDGIAVTEHRVPQKAGGGWPTLDQINKVKADDIFHMTCHGGLKDPTTGDLYWLLSDATISLFQVTPAFVRQLDLRETSPLVFGNACASAGGTQSDTRLSPGLATTFFSSGAINCVGTFAPITKALALKFPRRFYELLLGEGNLPVARALWETKKEFADDEKNDDPSYLFYCLYGPPDSVFVLTTEDTELEQVTVGDQPGS